MKVEIFWDYFESDQLEKDVERGRAITMDWDELAGNLVRATPSVLNARFKCPECLGTGYIESGMREIALRFVHLSLRPLRSCAGS